VVQQTTRNIRRGTVIIGLLAALFIGRSVFGNGSLLPGAIAMAILSLFSIAAAYSMYDVRHHVQVIPYFERTVGDIDTFLAGHALARSVTQLDEFARDNQLQPLSSFGFNDDLCGESLNWHLAEEGLKTVNGLLQLLPTRSELLRNHETLADDLEKLRHALERAKDQQIRFCLLLRHGNGTSGQEWSMRQGTAF
jgi:hypothetical protein